MSSRSLTTQALRALDNIKSMEIHEVAELDLLYARDCLVKAIALQSQLDVVAPHGRELDAPV